MKYPRLARRYADAVVLLVVALLVTGAVINVRRNPQPELVAEGTQQTVDPAWLARGRLPRTHTAMVRQALLDLKALTAPNGAALAGSDGPWRFVWPRDAAFVAAAYCATGFTADAGQVFDFLARVEPRSGRWAARYHPDGSGPVRDGRADQADGPGWVLWAAWFCASVVPEEDLLRAHWPMLRRSAERIVSELGPRDLPRPSPDYWERDESELTLGTVGPMLAGLQAGVRIAARLGEAASADRWRASADRLAAAVDRHFGSSYPRTRAGGADAIVTVLGPPFLPARPAVTEAIEDSHRVLTQPNGGVTPGQDWRADGVAWTPQTALFGLSAAARGDRAGAEAVLDWLAAHRTRTGSLPEKVNRHGRLAGEAPLGWTCALVVLTAATLDR